MSRFRRQNNRSHGNNKSPAQGSLLQNKRKGGVDRCDGFMDEPIETNLKRFPWKTFLFVIFFLVLGIICLACAGMLSVGFLDKEYSDRTWPLLILGLLMFVPGGYYSYIIVCIVCRRKGFSMADIPSI